MSIGIDFDNVITDSSSLKIARFLKHGFNMAPEDCCKELCARKGLSPDLYEATVREIYSSCADLPLIPGAKEAISRLYRANPVYIITARNGIETLCAKKVLELNKIPFTDIISAPDGVKRKACLSLGITDFLDDSYGNLTKLEGVRRYLFDRPTNRDILAEDGIIRTNWADFERRIRDLRLAVPHSYQRQSQRP